MTAKSISIKRARRRFGGCVRKAVVLTSGELDRVLGKGTEGIERDPDRDPEVSRRHSSREQSVHSIGTLARKGRNSKGLHGPGTKLVKA
jgi:hypothetical protein